MGVILNNNVFELLKRNHFTASVWQRVWTTWVVGTGVITDEELSRNTTLRQARRLVRSRLMVMFEETKKRCEEELAKLKKGGAEL